MVPTRRDTHQLVFEQLQLAQVLLVRSVQRSNHDVQRQMVHIRRLKARKKQRRASSDSSSTNKVKAVVTVTMYRACRRYGWDTKKSRAGSNSSSTHEVTR